MSTEIKTRRGTMLEHESFIGAAGEITVDTTEDNIRIHDGVKAGGHSVSLMSIARSLNVNSSDLTYDAPGAIVDSYIYSPSQQKTYAVPAGAIGETIVNVVNSQLTTNLGVYQLEPVNKSDLKMTLPDAVANPSLLNGDSVRVTDRGDAIFDVVFSASVPPANDATIIQCTGSPFVSLKLRKKDGLFTDVQTGLLGDGSDQLSKIQASFDYMESGDTFEFLSSEDVYSVSAPLSLMANVDWKAGYNASTARRGLSIMSHGAKVQFMDSVPFTGIFDNMPIEIRPTGFEATFTRQPSVLVVGSIDYFNYDGLELDGNMQARGANLGLPGALEQEHCLKIIGCSRVKVNTLTSMDSMGDGMNIGYPYLGGEAGVSQFRGAESLAGLCFDVTVNDFIGYRHSRLGISVVGCVKFRASNIHSEEIDSITDYTSLVGPGATIDIEYDSSNSFYSSSGFSLVEDVVIDGVSSKDNIYGGTVQVQNGRNVQISKVRCEGASLFGFGRFEGDASTPDGAKNVTVDDIIMSGSGSMVFYFRAAGENVTITNLTLSKGLTFSTGVTVPQKSHNLTIDGVRGDVVHDDVTGHLLKVADGATGLNVKNWNLNIDAASLGVRQPFIFDGSCEGVFDEITVNAPDSVPMSQLGRAAFHCSGSGVDIKCSDINMSIKTPSMMSQDDDADINSIEIRGGSARGLIYFPTANAFSNIYIESFTVESFYNDGSTTPAMLYLKVKSDQTIALNRVRGFSEGKYGFNKTKNGGRIACAGEFTALTNCRVSIDGLHHKGGRDTDNKYFLSAVKNGSTPTVEPWSVDSIRDLFDFSNVEINQSKRIKATPLNGSTVTAIDLQLQGNAALYPNSYADIINLTAGQGSASRFDEFYTDGGGSTTSKHVRVNYSAALTADLDLLIATR